MATKEKSSPGKKISFRKQDKPNLQATALSAIESALSPLSEAGTLPHDDDTSHFLGKIPISLKKTGTSEISEIHTLHTPQEPVALASAQGLTDTRPPPDRSRKQQTQSSPHLSSSDSVYNPRPQTRYPYWAAFIAALVWLAALRFFFWNQENFLQEGVLFSLPSLAYLSTLDVGRISWFIFPPLFFFFCAALFVRNQSLKCAIDTMNRMVAHLSNPESIAVDSVATLSQAVRREVAAIGDGVERALSRVGEFETMVRSEIGMLECAYENGEQRINALVDKLAVQKEEVTLTTDNLRTSIEDLHRSLAHDLEDVRNSLVVSLSEHIDLARTTLKTTSKDITHAMSSQVEETSNQLKNMSEMLFVSLGVRCADINQQLAETAQHVATDLLSHTNKLSDLFSEKCKEVYDSMSHNTLDLTDKWDAVGKKIFKTLEDGIEKARVNLELAAEKSVSGLDEKTENLCTSLVAHTRDAQDSFVTTGKDVVTAMALQTARIHEKLIHYTNSITTALKDQGAELNSGMGQQLVDLKTLLEDRATLIIQDLKTHLMTLNDTLSVQGAALNTSFADHTSRLDKTINQDGTHLLARVEEVTHKFSTHVHGCMNKATELFSDNGEKVMQAFEDKMQVIGGVLSNHFTVFESNTEAQISSFSQTTEALFRRLHDEIKNHFLQNSQTFQEDISGQSAALSELLTANEQKLRQALTEKVEHFEHTSSESNAHLQEILETAASTLERSLQYRGVEITKAVAEHTQHFEETLSNQLTTFNATFQDRTRGFEESFRDTSRFFEDLLHERFSTTSSLLDTRTVEFLENFQKQSDNLSREIIHIGETIVHTLEARATSVSDILHECSESLTNLMIRSTDALQEKIDTTTTRSVSQLVETNRLIQEDVGRISQELTDAGAALRAIVVETQTDFRDVEKIFSEQAHLITSFLGGLTQATDSSAQKLHAKIDELKVATQNALSETDILVNTLDSQKQSIVSFSHEHAETLMESVRYLENVGMEISHSLSARKDSLESALSNVLERTESITSVTATLDSDLRRHCTTMEATLNHVNEVLTHLEATHHQLQLSLLELPEVSEQTSIAMRRVIGDQVKALDTLNALVKRASTNGSGEVLSDTDRDSLPYLSKSKESHLSHLTKSPSFSPTSRYVSSERKATSTSLPQRKREFPASAPITSPTHVDAGWSPPPPLERYTSDKEKSTVVSQTPPFSPPQSVAKNDSASDRRSLRSHLALLNTLARDIPKVVDSQRIEDAWTRYQQGEPGAFTENLYTPHGKHVFKDVMRRYQESHDFRQTVAHYMDEFESLLESSGVDGSSPMKRAYLTSDTGKMYTFLAHLSGRL